MDQDVVGTAMRSRFRGALLGTLAGDALGATVEGTDAAQLGAILEALPTLPPAEQEMYRTIFGLITGLEVPPGSSYYTDDSQMMIGVAESLIAHPAFDGAHLAGRFAENFQPHRGYGAGAAALILELRKGEPWNDLAGRLFGGNGSYGNGGAMRVAPVGVLYHDNLPRLRRIAEAQARVTHTHILGVQGAVWQAAAVAQAVRANPNEPFDPFAFLQAVLDTVGPLENWYQEAANDLRTMLHIRLTAEECGETLVCGIEAHLSVPAALYAFLSHPNSFAEAVTFAVRMGGDTDTIGAMCGAIAGAFHGEESIPADWRDALENGSEGRDYVLALADNLFETWRAL